ncbi:hypothetical protein ACFL35_08200, partial [Candidatus Riflebacteria bacterium]
MERNSHYPTLRAILFLRKRSFILFTICLFSTPFIATGYAENAKIIDLAISQDVDLSTLNKQFWLRGRSVHRTFSIQRSLNFFSELQRSFLTINAALTRSHLNQVQIDRFIGKKRRASIPITEKEALFFILQKKLFIYWQREACFLVLAAALYKMQFFLEAHKKALYRAKIILFVNKKSHYYWNSLKKAKRLGFLWKLQSLDTRIKKLVVSLKNLILAVLKLDSRYKTELNKDPVGKAFKSIQTIVESERIVFRKLVQQKLWREFPLNKLTAQTSLIKARFHFMLFFLDFKNKFISYSI